MQVIKLWDLETGGEIFEYGEAHDGSAVTCMTLDNSQRRCVHSPSFTTTDTLAAALFSPPYFYLPVCEQDNSEGHA